MTDQTDTVLHNIAVFCASSPGTNPAVTEATVALGKALVSHDFGLVFGGASVGLMGLIADTVLDGGGRAVGVMPGNLPAEITHTGLTELVETADMHSRKVAMYGRCDACVSLPGGLGTLEELFEMATWTQLGIHAKPVGLLNVDGYYDHLIWFLDRAVADGLLKPKNRAIIVDDANPEALLAKLGTVDVGYTPKWQR